MCSSHIKWLWVAVLAVATAACGEDPEYRFGENISGLTFELYDVTEGIHPSTATLGNPRNPFRTSGVGMDTRFAINAGGGNAGAFYAWATSLATIPIGENQYFAAIKLRDIYLSGEVAPEDRETVRMMAVNGFQAILDCFPDDLLFDATGTFSLRLATLAFQEILDLGGVPQGDWVLATDSRGDPVAIRSTGFDTLARDFLCF